MTNDPGQQATTATHTPHCPRCGKPMQLARIEPDKPDYDRRVFHCAGCGESESEIVKFR